MRVIVCGGRDYQDADTIRRVLALFTQRQATIVHGGARGCDRHAGKVADLLGLPVEVHEAEWEMHGKSAGPIRNREMLEAGADFVVAFPGGNGTRHMVNIARKAGVTVLEVS